MTEAEQALVEDRALRDGARAVFDARLSGIRAALNARGVVPRARDEALDRGRAAASEAAEIASEYRWIVASTLLAILAWLLRRPLIHGADKVRERLLTREPATRWQRWRKRIEQKVRP